MEQIEACRGALEYEPCGYPGMEQGACSGGACGPARCNPAVPFTTFRPLTELNTAGVEFGAVLSYDELTIYFSSTGTGGDADIFRAIRASSEEVFGAPSPVGINTAANENGPSLSSDELTLYFERDGQIFAASRATVADAFVDASPISTIDSTADEVLPRITGDDLALYFMSSRSGGGDIYRSLRDSTGDFAPPEPVVELNSTTYDASISVTARGLQAYVGRYEPPGSPNRGGEIWQASRSSTEQRFASFVAVAELNTLANEYPTWISADQCVLLFGSDRGGGGGADHDLWIARRAP